MKKMHFYNPSNLLLIFERRSQLRRRCRRRIPLFCYTLLIFTIVWGLTTLRKNSTSDVLISKHQELQAQLHRLEASYQTRQLEVNNLTSLLDDLLSSSQSDMKVNQDTRSLSSLCLPSVYTFMPHLRKIASIQPALLLSQGRSGVSMVFGISTIRRVVKNYFFATLRNLLDNMTPKEAEDALIIVLVAETDSEYVFPIFEELQEQFSEELESGVLDVISPPASFYPDLQSVRATLGEDIDRVRWRSKQSLDYAFLMMYAQEKGIFYVQLEDDIESKKNFTTIMKKEYLRRLSKTHGWLLMSFSRWGFIGKMMKCVELPYLIEFLFLFYNDQPVDWSIENLSEVIMGWDWNYNISRPRDHLRIRFTPSLFQHVGLYSSLKGKIQKLKDVKF